MGPSTPKENLVQDLLQSVKEKLNSSEKMHEDGTSSQMVSANGDALPKAYRLKNIRSMITPELLFTLGRAGNEDTLVFAANGFPSHRYAENYDYF